MIRLALALFATALSASTARAAVLIDTGAPPNGGPAYTLSFFQSLGIHAHFNYAVRISSVEGFISSNGDHITIKIHEEGVIGKPKDTPPLFSGSFIAGNAAFQGLSDLSWEVGPGSYFVTFQSDGDRSSMPFPAPRLIPRILVLNERGGDTVWREAATGTGMGLRVKGDYINGGPPPPSIPEPAAWAMMIGGLGLVGSAMRKRPRISLTYASPNRPSS